MICPLVTGDCKNQETITEAGSTLKYGTTECCPQITQCLFLKNISKITAAFTAASLGDIEKKLYFHFAGSSTRTLASNLSDFQDVNQDEDAP